MAGNGIGERGGGQNELLNFVGKVAGVDVRHGCPRADRLAVDHDQRAVRVGPVDRIFLHPGDHEIAAAVGRRRPAGRGRRDDRQLILVARTGRRGRALEAVGVPSMTCVVCWPPVSETIRNGWLTSMFWMLAGVSDNSVRSSRGSIRRQRKARWAFRPRGRGRKLLPKTVKLRAQPRKTPDLKPCHLYSLYGKGTAVTLPNG